MKIITPIVDFLIPKLELIKNYSDGPLEFRNIMQNSKDLISKWPSLKPIYHSGSIGVPYDRYLKIIQFAKNIGVNYFSIAIGHPCENTKISKFTNKKVAASELFTKKKFFKIVGEKLSLAKKYFGYVGVENLDYNEGGPKERSAYELLDGERITTPNFIKEFINKFDVYLLLDIGHVEVSAEKEGITSEEYLLRLPLERIYEIHFHHAKKVNGILRDAHQSPTEVEYNLLEKILMRSNPEYITLEIRKDFKTYFRELKKLRRWIDKK